MVISIASLIQWLIILPILGALVVVIGLRYKRKYYEGKIKCVFYMRNKEVIERILKPSDRNLLLFNEGFYIYRDNWVRLAKSQIAGTIPQLTYVENNPVPINLEGYASIDLGLTARQIRTDFEDNAMQTFAASTDMDTTADILQKIKLWGIIGVGGIIIMQMAVLYMTNGG